MIASQHPDFNGFLHLNVSRLSDALVVRFQQPDLLTEENVVRGIGGEFAALANRPDCQKVIVDFTDVEDLSSYMLGRLVMLRKNMAARQGQMVLRGLTTEVREFFDETMLSELFEIADSAGRKSAALAG